MIDISVSFLTKAFALSIPIGVVFCAIIALAYVWVVQNENSDGAGRSGGGRSSGAGGRSGGGASGAGGRSGAGRAAGGRSSASGGGRSSGGGSLLGGLLKELGEGIGAASAGVGRGIGDTLKGGGEGAGKLLGGVGSLTKGVGEGGGKLLGGVGDGGGKLLGGVGDGGGKLLGGVGAVAKGVGDGGGKLLGGAGDGVGAVAKGMGDGGGKLLGGIGSLANGLAKPLGTLGNGIGRVTQAARNEVVKDVAWGWDAYQGHKHAHDQHDQQNQPDQLPRNVFDAGTQDDAETIRDLCKACNIEADIDGTHVAINPHKLAHAQQVLGMAGYDVTFADDSDDEDIVLDYDPDTDTWALNENGQTWRDTFQDVKGQVLNWWDPALYPADQPDQQAQQPTEVI